MSKSVVWVPQEPMKKEWVTLNGMREARWVSKGFDLATANDFGIVSIIWPPDASVINREVMEREAFEIAARYDEKEDYILALGSPTLIALLAWAIGQNQKTLRMLEWDRGLRRYNPTLTDLLPDLIRERE